MQTAIQNAHDSQIIQVRQRLGRLLFWYAFFMAFPGILIFQNISIYIFPFLLLTVYELTGRVFTIRYKLQFLAIAFAIGAIVSTMNIPINLPSDSTSRALEVLPNYIYWVILILFLTSNFSLISLPVVYEGLFWGVAASTLYYFFFQNLGIAALPIFKLLSQNTYAFLLICYTPIVVWYVSHRYGFWRAFVLLVVLSACGFLSGSRSGSLLTLSGGALTLILDRKSISGIFLIGVTGYVVAVSLLNTILVKEIISGLNRRTYDLIYSYDKILDEDRSHLVRLAQIEKATLIFAKYPVSGIGLNNFANYKIKLPGNFVNADFVVSKKGIDRKSAHNSYYGFLAEGGLILFIPFALLLGTCIIWFFLRLRTLASEYKPIFVGIVHMSIHLYFIYAILNVFAWFLIGLGCLIIVKNRG